jgi:hypothetical protein
MTMGLNHLRTGAPWVGAGIGVGVPGYTFFTTYPPPLFPMISLITALSAAILIIVLAWRPRRDSPRQSTPRIVKKAGYSIGAALLLLVVYGLLFNFTTIATPSGNRLQTGFGRAYWSLTEAGKAWVRTQPDITVVQMVSNEAAFDQDRLTILWPTWSIYSAGALLIFLYFSGFILWATGFALLTKQQSVNETDRKNQ